MEGSGDEQAEKPWRSKLGQKMIGQVFAPRREGRVDWLH
jgi:hypothetical protein